MTRLAPLLLLALGACAAGPQGREQAADRRNDPRFAACQAEATRVVQYRDRGQLMRNDEAENRLGTLASPTPFSRTERDRLGAQVERDRLVEECLRAGAPPGGR